MELVPVSMARGLGDPVSAGVTVGAACIVDRDMTSRGRRRRLRGLEDLTTEQKRAPTTPIAQDRRERHAAQQQTMTGATALV